LGVILLLAGAAAVYPGRQSQPKQTKTGNRPYWQRTGFLSKTMLEFHAAEVKGIASIRVPEGFEVIEAAGPGVVTYPMFTAFDDRGRLFVCESAGKNIPDDEMSRLAEMRVRML
jgi:hypothetical protein